MLDLSVLARPPVEPWFEIHWHHLKGMETGTIDTHIRSMLQSQKDYGADLRFVIDPDTDRNLLSSSNVFDLHAYPRLPSEAMKCCKEVVIRYHDKEFVLTDAEGNANIFRTYSPFAKQAPTAAPAAPQAETAVAPLTGKRMMDL